ncbi:hypothetical protein J3L18_19110 [Mucilaginibacter gossypii]|uniref:hypothetical protein n=1 Tax=Mucilaginibacter gossypii TaxID=551996 RepID=UPI000DCBC9E0|nr:MULTISPECIES: hypothetical protein [Mucilaginibacter]QTE35250.1 hypothetical protein J3L18_19110 [Mucilaginibacter gossypii]RAV58127.1 hypothetical protein DIU36_10405 [Mucilaginibacter rubeus]
MMKYEIYFRDDARRAALVIGADTGLWLMPVQYERIARAAGNAHIYKSIKKLTQDQAIINKLA